MSQIKVVQAVHIDPGHRIELPDALEIRIRPEGPFLKELPLVLDQLHPDGFGTLRPHVHHGTRGSSRLLPNGSKETSHGSREPLAGVADIGGGLGKEFPGILDA